MIKRTLTVLATVAVSATGTSLAVAQNYAPYPSYSAAPRAMDSMPDFDATDDDAPGARGPVALSPPGPVMSPDDPRYGRPYNAAPTYSERSVPQGPVMSPDDPRYGRPDTGPAVIYSDRDDGRAAAPRSGYSDGLRPPEAVGTTGSVPPADARGGRPVQLSALPPEEQPDVAPAELAPNLRRQEVNFVTKEPAGTIVVDTPNTYLYYVLGNGRAVRYGIRVGRDGFRWSGTQKVTRKTEWPDWHPPAEMIERQPYLPRFMAGGEGNPLGARAMYLGSTVYRIHGTNQPSTIGKTVSSGCFGMLNDDVMDLFERVKVGTRVVVLPGNPPATASTQPGAPEAGPTTTASAQPLPPAPATSYGGSAGTQPTVVPPLPAPVNVR